MENKNMTAVEWLINQVQDNMGDIPLDIQEQVKQMFKDQIKESWNDGNLLGRNGHVLLEYSTGEGYYKETYGKGLPELRYKDGRPMRIYNSPKLQAIEMENELEEAAEKYSLELLEAKTIDPHEKTWIKSMFIHIVKWQQERMLKFILDEDNHTEGELGNSCIDVQTLVHFIEQFKKK
jgi:hypothetical protein